MNDDVDVDCLHGMSEDERCRPTCLDGNGAKLSSGDRVAARFVVRDGPNSRGELVLVTEEPINPTSDDPDYRRGSVHWLLPHQVERVEMAMPPATPDPSVEDLLRLCHEALAREDSSTASWIVAIDALLRWVESRLARLESRGHVHA